MPYNLTNLQVEPQPSIALKALTLASGQEVVIGRLILEPLPQASTPQSSKAGNLVRTRFYS